MADELKLYAQTLRDVARETGKRLTLAEKTSLRAIARELVKMANKKEPSMDKQFEAWGAFQQAATKHGFIKP